MGDVVSADAGIFVALVATTNDWPYFTTGTKWDPMVYGYIYRGTFDPTAYYSLHDLATYQGSLYISKATTPYQNHGAWDATQWDLVAARGSDGAAGAGINFRGAWAPTTVYNALDVVTNGGQLYEADHTFTSGSSFNAANWNLWAAKGADGATGPAGPPASTANVQLMADRAAALALAL